jgi:hypothetical protein
MARTTEGTTIRWNSVAGGQYAVGYKDELSKPWTMLAAVVGQQGTTTWTDVSAAAEQKSYRVIEIE